MQKTFIFIKINKLNVKCNIKLNEKGSNFHLKNIQKIIIVSEVIQDIFWGYWVTNRIISEPSRKKTKKERKKSQIRKAPVFFQSAIR